MDKSVCLRLVFLSAALCVCIPTMAQPSFLGRGQHGIAFSLAAIDFSYAGSVTPVTRYDYQGSSFGLTYAGPNTRAMAVYGRQDGTLGIIDVSASFWGLLPFANVTAGNTRLGVPIGLLVGWRRIAKGDGIEPYAASSLGFGVGGALQHLFSQRITLDLRVSPYLGGTGSQLADQMGLSWAAEADAQLDLEEVFSGIGFIIGYTFRYQYWNVNGSRPFSDAVDETLDYRGLMHVFRAGIKL